MKDFVGAVKLGAGVEHAGDVLAVFAPSLHFVKVLVVGVVRIVGFFVALGHRAWSTRIPCKKFSKPERVPESVTLANDASAQLAIFRPLLRETIIDDNHLTRSRALV